MVKILQKGEQVLREIAQPIPVEDIRKPKIQKILKDMKSAMNSQDDAVAIAAPQIGVPLQIFIVSKKIFEISEDNDEESASDIIFINPEIIKLSRKTTWQEEGCLSVRKWYGEVKRAQNATVVAYDEKGNRFTRGAGGLLAQIFQHETDHLIGVLFTDKAKDLRELEDNDE